MKLYRGKGLTIFFTGLSGSGKSTIAKKLYEELVLKVSCPVYVLDGDLFRKQFSPELGFSRADREANLRRACLIAKKITESGGIAICAFIAPYENSRKANRKTISQYGSYIEVYLSTPIEECEKRDPKGLYVKARQKLIKNFTGIDDPYEVPINPELTFDTTYLTPDEIVNSILKYLKQKNYLDGSNWGL